MGELTSQASDGRVGMRLIPGLRWSRLTSRVLIMTHVVDEFSACEFSDSEYEYEICFVNGFDSYTADFIASS